MNIAHVTATFPPYQGGTGNACFYMGRELARRGHSIHVFTTSWSNAPVNEVLQGINIHRLRPVFRIGNAALLPQLIFKLWGFDVIHLHYPFFGGEFAALAARLTRAPLVITYHHDVHLKGIRELIGKVQRWTFGRLTLRSAERLMFTSDDYARFSYIRPLLVGREKTISAVSNGVDVSAFTPGIVPSALDERFRWSQEDRLALLVACLDQAHYFKGVDVFLEALAQLPANIRGLIIGEGDMREEYENNARALGIASRVSFAGRVSDVDLPDYYRMADVTVLPSVTMGEAFGLVLVESMACGTPVIASNLPGVRTVVLDGQDGLLVKPCDVPDLAAKIQSFLDLSVEERQAMGERGRVKVEAKYAWPRIVDRLEQIYSLVIEMEGLH